MTFFTKSAQVTFATCALVSYLGFGIFGFMHMFEMASMDMPMIDCPFVQMEHSVCFMNTVDHVRAWQNVSSFFSPIYSLYIASVALVGIFLVLYFAFSLLRFLLYALDRKLHSLHYLYRYLFSQGILHSKLF